MTKLAETFTSWSLSLKVLLISSGVLSMAVVLKLSVPLISQFVISDFPSIWEFFVSWLKPPYLYLIFNCIIITIVAASKFHQNADDPPPVPVLVKITEDLETNFADSYDIVVPTSTPVEVRPEIGYDYDVNVYDNVESRVSETKKMVSVMKTTKEMDGVDEISIMRPSSNTETSLSEYLFATEKPPVSVRFGNRKVVKASPEGGRTKLKVSKPKRHDTLESTWKTITDGRPMPLTRHLRKSDTWDTHGHHVSNVGHSQDVRMRKSETFNVDLSSSGGTNSNSSLSRLPSSEKLRREASPSQDELNKRVEAFITKFNEDMRLQKQESLNQYMEMINRGAH